MRKIQAGTFGACVAIASALYAPAASAQFYLGGEGGWIAIKSPRRNRWIAGTDTGAGFSRWGDHKASRGLGQNVRDDQEIQRTGSCAFGPLRWSLRNSEGVRVLGFTQV